MSTVIELSPSGIETVTLDEHTEGFAIFYQIGDYSPTLVTLNHDAAGTLADCIRARIEHREAVRQSLGQLVLEFA